MNSCPALQEKMFSTYFLIEQQLKILKEGIYRLKQDFYEAFILCFNYYFKVSDERGVSGLQPTVSGLAKVAIFTIPIAIGIDAENQTLNNHKCVCGALNRHFCQTRVSSRAFLFHGLLSSVLRFSYPFNQ
jgi:hypothetical protein